MQAEAETTVPAQIQGLNWGAFFLSWIWAIFNQVWIGLLALIPCIEIFVAIFLLIKGNELAWKGPRQWESVEQFQTVQAAWMKWGLVIFVIRIVVLVIYGAAIMAAIAHALGTAPTTTQ